MDKQTAARKALMLTQAEAAYTVLSNAAGQACVNCRWFTMLANSAGACNLVECEPAPIVITGLCNRWEAVPAMTESEQPTVEVEIEIEAPEAADVDIDSPTDIDDFVSDADYRALKLPEYSTRKERVSFVQAVYSAVKDLLAPTEHVSGFKAIGNQWFAVWSNNFEDKQRETFSAKAIDEYIARIDSGLTPLPELWFWHEPLVSGKADMIARVDHMVIAAGHFADTDTGRAFQAYYANTKDAHAVSHGFRFPRGSLVDGVYTYFDTFEISPLPKGTEANEFTTFEGGIKAMAVPEHKMQALEKMFGKARASALVTSVQSAGKDIEQLGISYKSLEVDTVDTEARKAISELTELMKSLTVNVKALADMKKPADDEEDEDMPKKRTPAKADEPAEKALPQAQPPVDIAAAIQTAVKQALAAHAAEQASYNTRPSAAPQTVVTANDPVRQQMENAMKAGGGSPDNLGLLTHNIMKGIGAP